MPDLITLEQRLERIRYWEAEAQKAIADEHEGQLKLCLRNIVYHANEAESLVLNW